MMAMFLKLRVHSASASRAFGIGRASESGNRYSYDFNHKHPPNIAMAGAICEDLEKAGASFVETIKGASKKIVVYLAENFKAKTQFSQMLSKSPNSGQKLLIMIYLHIRFPIRCWCGFLASSLWRCGPIPLAKQREQSQDMGREGVLL